MVLKSEAIQNLKHNDIPNVVYVVIWLNHEGRLGMATFYTVPRDDLENALDEYLPKSE